MNDNEIGPIPKPRYKCRCEHCGQDTVVGYDEWLNLTELMMTFSGLTAAQKEIILLMIDGAKYRQGKKP